MVAIRIIRLSSHFNNTLTSTQLTFISYVQIVTWCRRLNVRWRDSNAKIINDSGEEFYTYYYSFYCACSLSKYVSIYTTYIFHNYSINFIIPTYQRMCSQNTVYYAHLVLEVLLKLLQVIYPCGYQAVSRLETDKTRSTYQTELDNEDLRRIYCRAVY